MKKIPKEESRRPTPIKIQLTGEYIELNHLLKLAGLVGSGGAGKAMVAAGGVKIDGKEESRKTCKIRAGQVVKAMNTRIRVLAAPAAPGVPGEMPAPAGETSDNSDE